MQLKTTLSILLTVFLFLKNYAQAVVDEKFHDKVLSEYFTLKSKSTLYDHLELQNLFQKIADIDNSYLKILEKDIYKLKKIIKKHKKNKNNTEKEIKFLENLQELYSFLKKYYLQIEVISFHSILKKDWQQAMNAVDKAEDILPILKKEASDQDDIKTLKEFIKKMNKFLQTLDNYEHRLHTDWIDLKLINYILKIEVIRLRNAAIFHPLYYGMPIKTSYPR